jgi:hypothetical protein
MVVYAGLWRCSIYLLLLLARFALAFSGWLFGMLWFLGLSWFFSVLFGVRLRAWLLLNLLLLDLLNLRRRLHTLCGLHLSFLSLNRHGVLLDLLHVLLCMWLCHLTLRSCLRIRIGIACFRPAILTNTLLPINFAAVYYARLSTLLHIGGLRLLLLLQHRLRHLIHNGRALC